MRVNWELEPGERIEEFVAALLLLRHDGPGNRITPSRGDRGVDVRLQNPDGFRFFQVKRYTRPLTAAQEREVRKSWQTFVRDTVPREAVTSWTLACPLDPSNERLDWLRDLTQGSPFPVNWLDRTALDAMAAENPSLVAYYFAGGEDRLHRQLADAFQAAREIPQGMPSEDLLDAAALRLLALRRVLDNLDPFYRYELEIKAGRVKDDRMQQYLQDPSGAALIELRQLDEEHYQLVRIIPRRQASGQFRPVTANVVLHAVMGSPEHAALEAFHNFGAPVRDVIGTVVEASGPPRARQPLGEGSFTIMPLSANSAGLPDLEVRLADAQGRIQHAVDLVDVRLSRGLGEAPGVWLSGRDPADAVVFTFLLNGPDGISEARIEPQPIVGKAPGAVLPALRMKVAMVDGAQMSLAVRGGRQLGTPWHLRGALDQPGLEAGILLLEALADIQRHTITRVVIPDPDITPAAELDEIVRVGQLLRGESLEATWAELPLTVTTPERLPPADIPELVFCVDRPLVVRLNNQDVELDMIRRTLYRNVSSAGIPTAATAQTGDHFKLVPGLDSTAVIIAVPRKVEGAEG